MKKILVIIPVLMIFLMGCSDSNNKNNEEDLDETQLIPMSYASDTGELVKKVIENFLILEKYTEITIGDYLESSSSNLSEMDEITKDFNQYYVEYQISIKAAKDWLVKYEPPTPACNNYNIDVYNWLSANESLSIWYFNGVNFVNDNNDYDELSYAELNAFDKQYESHELCGYSRMSN